MDPLTAIGLASNIAQFIEFTYKLISGAHDISRSSTGLFAQHEEVDLIAQSVLRLHESVEVMSGPSLELHKLSDRDRNLLPFREACVSVGKELIGHLSQLKSQGSSRKWETVRAALRSLLKEKNIKELEDRLIRLQRQIDSVILSDIEKRQAEVLQLLRRQIRWSNGDLQIWRELSSATRSIERSFERLEYYLIANEGLSHDARRQRSILSVEAKRTESCNLARLAKKTQMLMMQHAVLASLDYEMRTSRDETIKQAHTETFQWIYKAEDGSPSLFQKWLEDKSGIFWITGKPGSGKSTLMKYLWYENMTQASLEEWAKGSRLLTASFYFWSPGTAMQKSIDGLLRSLIVQVLDQCPELMPKVLPKRWEELEKWTTTTAAYGAMNPLLLAPWSTTELLSALQALTAQANFRTHFCFFIDGLDEYNGSDKEMVEIISTFGASPYFKFCLSSRPHAQFNRAYGKDTHRSLSVSSLTSNDIRKYVKDKLTLNKSFQAMCAEYGARGKQLVEDVVTNANGVFLWVYLVVERLIEGIEVNSDRMSDLERKLKSIPKELDQLFRLILDSVDADYHEAQAHMLRVASTADHAYDLMAYYYMDMEEEHSALHMQFDPITPLEVLKQQEIMATRINVRCKGLLEVVNHRTYYDRALEDKKVQLLHRTLRDFLAEEDMQSVLQKRSAVAFDPYRSICLAMLAEIKSSHIDCDDRCHHYFLLDRILSTARSSEIIQGTSPNDILDEISKQLPFLANKHSNRGLYMISNYFEVAHRQGGLPFLFVQQCAGLDLEEYPRSQIRKLATSQTELDQLLHKSVPVYKWCSQDFSFEGLLGNDLSSDRKPKIVEILLEFGADPNTVWDEFLEDIPTRTLSKKENTSQSSFWTMKLLLEYGASTLKVDKIVTRAQNFEPEETEEIMNVLRRSNLGCQMDTKPMQKSTEQFEATGSLQTAHVTEAKTNERKKSSKRFSFAILK